MILLTGASGTLGKEVAKVLVNQAKPFQCLVRESSDVTALEAIGAPLCYGDVRDGASLDAAMADVDAVISTHTLGMPRKGVTHWDVDYQGNVQLIERLAARGGGKYVFISGLGAKITSSFPLYKVKQLVEDLLCVSGLDYTVLRSSGFFTDFTMNVDFVKKYHLYPAMGGAEHRIHGVHQGDLALVAAGALDNPKASKQVISVGGPEILQAKDVAAIYSEILGRKVRVLPIPPGVPKAAGLMVDTFTGYRYHMRGMMEAFLSDSVSDNTKLLETFDIPLRPLASYLREFLGR